MTARAYGFLEGFGFFVGAALLDPNAPETPLRHDDGASAGAGRLRDQLQLLHEQALVVSGWAIDLRSAQPVAGVAVQIDRHLRVETRFGSRREDVACAFGNPQYAECEFTAVIPPAALPVGKHTISLLLMHPGGHGEYSAVPDAITVVVRPQPVR